MFTRAAAFLALVVSTSAFAPLQIPEEDTPIQLNVQCSGVDWAKLSLSDRTYTAHVLEDTFNELHMKLDDGDQHLDAIVPAAQGELAQEPLTRGGSIWAGT